MTLLTENLTQWVRQPLAGPSPRDGCSRRPAGGLYRPGRPLLPLGVASYNICRTPDTIDVEKARLADGPFDVRQINASSDDNQALVWYTGPRLRGLGAETGSSLALSV